ncbi:MAG: hypothetical protein OXI36_09235 [Gammaproteobacteria bacterium]|nr:hypothetical protein [Gammaproteobacteria bacterium]MDE0403592.1 hypothetical protein [Gammaproteobacteria bacterium]MYF53205.1 hypothetical protein [Gammaproteobacteria bacterium]
MDLLKMLTRFLLSSAITFVCFVGFAEEEIEDVEPTEVEETEVELSDESEAQEDEQTVSEKSIESDAEDEQEPDLETETKKPWKRLPSKPLPVGSNVELPQDI